MKEAQQKLEEAKRRDATEKQAEALKELEQAKAELEEILRQLREEEMARTLAMLEARFRKMLDQQVEVYEGTKRLDKVAEAERDRDDEIEAGRLSRKEAADRRPRPTRPWPCCARKARPWLSRGRRPKCATTWSRSSSGWRRPRSAR